MTLDAIKSVIEQLPQSEQDELVKWFDERYHDAWDRQMDADFAPGGRGEQVLADIRRQVTEGKTAPIEEGFAKRRK